MAGTYKYGHMVGVRRGKSIQQTEDMSKSQDTELAIEQARKWIEECTEASQQDISFRELVKDGTLLCELIQKVQPGLIRKINRHKTPFGGRENLSFFLDACRKLGLKGSQLFDPEDLQGSQGPSFRSELRSNSSRGRRDENERKLRNVAVTIYWLGKKLNQLPGYSGPELDLSAFQNLVGSQRRRSYSAAGRLSNSSSVNSSVNSSPTKPPYNTQNGSSNSGSIASPSSSKTSLDNITPVSPDHTPAATVVNFDIHKTPHNTTTNITTARQHTAVKSYSVPVDVEAVPPCSPLPAESLQEEEEITEKENNPVSPDLPATPVKQAESPQIRTQEDNQINEQGSSQADTQDTSQANSHDSKQAKPLNDTQAEVQSSAEPISHPVALSNNLTANHTSAHIRQPSSNLQYTIADVDILDSTSFGLEETSDLLTDHKVAKFEELSSPEEVLPVNPPLKGKVFCVDTADCSEEMAGVLPNGHAVICKNHGLPNGNISTLGRLLNKEFDVSVRLDTGEKRFGFSVIGGSDEGFPARVESIAAGSAASRVDLKPGDELIAMDNMPLSTIEHAAVIKMIQKASQSGRVLLRIKRITAKEPSVDIGPSVVAVTNGETSDDDHKHSKDGDKLNNGFVRVESKAVPTPQHPTKVIYPPDVVHLQRHLELVSDSYSDDNSTRAELGSNVDERSISSDDNDSQQADSVTASTEVLGDEISVVSNEPVPSVDSIDQIPSPSVEQVPNTTVKQAPINTEQAISISTEQTPSEEVPTSMTNGDAVTSPIEDVVVLQSSLNVTSTMSVVRPRSAPQSKLHKVLPADSSKCFTTQDTPAQSIGRHQSQRNVVEVKYVKEMHKYSSLPSQGRQMSMETCSKQFTLLNSFKDSREAIDEIWKSVTLGDTKPVSPEDVIVDVPTSPVELQAAVSMSSSLAVNASEGDPSSPTTIDHMRDNQNDGNVEGGLLNVY